MILIPTAPQAEPIPCLRGLDPAEVMARYPTSELVYLLHLDDPFVVNGYEWQHYFGSARAGRLVARMHEHRTGSRGARFLLLARQAGCTWHLARVWEGGYTEEQRIKAMGGGRRSCPSCGRIPRAERQQYRDPAGHYIKIERRLS